MYSYFDKVFSRSQCSFCKGMSTKNILLTMQVLRDNKQFCTAILTDLSKGFNCIHYDLLITRLNAYSFDQGALQLSHSYPCERSQTVQVGSSFSKKLDISCGIPEGSILFQYYLICNLIFIDMSSDIANYVDNTTPYEGPPYYH